MNGSVMHARNSENRLSSESVKNERIIRRNIAIETTSRRIAMKLAKK